MLLFQIIKLIISKKTIKGWRFFWKDYFLLKKQKGNDNTFPWGRFYPILNDRYDNAGVMSGHYFHQDLYVASQIFKNKPILHVDIGSRIDGFVAHVASFRPIEIIDIRAIESKVANISFKQQDLMQLPENMLSYCDSISCLHAIEHFGLGRYSDPIDYFGHEKAMSNILQILKPGGKFYFSTPIGPQRIEFNAHRVFSIQYLIDLLSPNFEIEAFSYVDDKGDLFVNVELKAADIAKNFGCYYGCGIFEMRKK